LATNIASGYADPTVEARTELWVPQIERWISSDRPTLHLKLYIESAANANLTNTANIFAITTMVFASTTAFVRFLFQRNQDP